MLKNVKARKYKSKQEFSADLGLIWKNCFKYNSGPVSLLCFARQRAVGRSLSRKQDHVLRGCVTRLKRKADHLLAHVSDRPDLITINGILTPSAPPSSTSSRDSPYKPVKSNGIINGIISSSRGMCPGLPLFQPRDLIRSLTHPTDMPTPDPSTPHAELTPNTPGPSHSHSKSPRSASAHASPAKPSPPSAPAGSIPFEDQPALIRTPASMNIFMELDRELQRALDGVPEDTGMLPMMDFDAKGKGKETLQQRLWNLVDEDMDGDQGDAPDGEGDDEIPAMDTRRKRKWCAFCVWRLFIVIHCLQVDELS